MLTIMLSILLGAAAATVLFIVWFAVICTKDVDEDRRCVMVIPIGPAQRETAEWLVRRFHTSASFYSELSYARVLVADTGMDGETRRIVETLVKKGMVDKIVPQEELHAGTLLGPL